MVTYMLMMKLTDQGLKELKKAPQRIEEGIKAFEKINAAKEAANFGAKKNGHIKKFITVITNSIKLKRPGL